MSSEVDAVVAFFVANGFFFELLVSVLLFARGLARRPWFAARAVASVAGLIAVSSAWGASVPATMWTSMARFVVLMALAGAAIGLCWRLRARQAVFYLVVAAVMQHVAFRGARIVTALAQQVAPDVPWLEAVVYPVALVPFFALGYVLFARPIRDESTEGIGHGSILLLLAGMLISVNVFTHVFDELSTGQTFGLDAAYFLLDLVTCVFLLALTKEIVHRQSAEQDSAIMRHLLHQQKTQLESSKETIELINVKTHDLKKQIARLGDRIPQDEVDELRELVGIYDAVTRTGNEALDVLLAEKVLLCETRGIQFDRLVDGSALDPMKPGDVYALLGNALDNAMEAVADVSDPGRRYIALRVRRSRGLVAVHVENAYAGERTFVDGLPVTTKADTRYHGFGMRSIRMICEKYDGHLSVAARDGVFSLTVLLPLAAAAARG
jgi:hypothetical protein